MRNIRVFCLYRIIGINYYAPPEFCHQLPVTQMKQIFLLTCDTHQADHNACFHTGIRQAGIQYRCRCHDHLLKHLDRWRHFCRVLLYYVIVICACWCLYRVRYSNFSDQKGWCDNPLCTEIRNKITVCMLISHPNGVNYLSDRVPSTRSSLTWLPYVRTYYTRT